MAWFIAYIVSVIVFHALFSSFLPSTILSSKLYSLFILSFPIILIVALGSILDYFQRKGIIESPPPNASPPKVSPDTKDLVDSVLSEKSTPSPEKVQLVSPPDPPEPDEPPLPRPLTVDERLCSVDSLDGPAFEKWCADLLERAGFIDVQLTKTSGDQGGDIVAVKDDVQYAFQCKCYSSDLGNHPVQEVHAGKILYGCHVGVVMTNRRFTPGARKLAKATGTLLWDRDKLKAMIQTAYGEEYVPPIVGASIFESDPSSYWD